MRERKGRKSKSVFCVLLESEWRKKAKRDYYHTKHAIRRLLFNQIRSWTFIPDNNFCLYKPFSLKNTIKDFLNIIIFFLICMFHVRSSILQNCNFSKKFFRVDFLHMKRTFVTLTNQIPLMNVIYLGFQQSYERSADFEF